VESPHVVPGSGLRGRVRNGIVRPIDTRPIRERTEVKVEEAEKHLKDYLLNGIAAEIFWADEAYALAEEISKHAQSSNATRFRSLFGSLQVIFSDRQTLSVTKLFDKPKNYPTRSIPATLDYLKAHAELWRVPQQHVLHQILIDAGAESASVERLSNAELTYEIVKHYEYERSRFEPALNRLRQSRDKIISHNEAIERSALQSPTWGDAISLVKYAKNFVSTIGSSYLSIIFGSGRGDYHLSYDARRTSMQLRRLLEAVNIPD
jgi:hypothetical protein